MTKYLNLPMVLILIGGILAVVGAFLATFRQNQEKLQSSQERAAFEKELRTKSDEIADLNRVIAQSVTGGNSFCYISVLLGPTDNPMLMIHTEGEFPMYDVTIRMWEPSRYTNLPANLSIEDITKNDTLNRSIGNLPANQAMTLGRISLAGAERKDLRFNYQLEMAT